VIQQLLNNSRFQAGIAANYTAQLRLGIVTSYNPTNQTVQVTIQPVEDDGNGQTGWIPLATNFIGLVGAPNINDQVLVLFQEGSLNTGMVVGRLYSDVDPAPAVPAGEWWLTHPSGSSIKLKTNGDVDVVSPTNVNVSAPNVNLSNGGALKKLVTESFVQFFNDHVHGGSPPPTTPMTSAQLTTIVEAQ